MNTLLCEKLEIGQFSNPDNNSSKEAEHMQSTQQMQEIIMCALACVRCRSY